VPTSIVKPIVLHFTNDEKEVEKGRDAEVTVKVVVQQTAELDKELVKVLDGTGPEKDTKAIDLQEKQVALLQSVVDLDAKVLNGKNKVASLLQKAKDALAQLKENGATKETRKEAHHRGYMKSRG